MEAIQATAPKKLRSFTARIPDDLRRQLRLLAVQKDKKVQEMTAEVLRLGLEQLKNQ